MISKNENQLIDPIELYEMIKKQKWEHNEQSTKK